MKLKLFAVMLALISVSWAQTVPPAAPSQNQKDQVKTSCPCCATSAATEKCGDHCMRNKDAKEKMSCCSGKDSATMQGMACMRDKSDKTASADCKNCCKGDKKMSCCSGKGTKSAMNCCGDHCARPAASTTGI